jgi:hypothetical protein
MESQMIPILWTVECFIEESNTNESNYATFADDEEAEIANDTYFEEAPQVPVEEIDEISIAKEISSVNLQKSLFKRPIYFDFPTVYASESH